jgi:hypothetical protein
VVIARAGSEETPVELFVAPQPEPTQRGPDVAPSATRPAASRGEGSGAVVWPWIVGASLAIAAGVIVTILLLTADGDTQVIGPAPAGLRLGSW